MSHDEAAPHRLNRLIAEFVSSGILIEKYLHLEGPLTDLQEEALALSLGNIGASLDTWKRKYGQKK